MLYYSMENEIGNAGMRMLGFSKRWQKLSNSQFTTFRFKRRDKRDWQVDEVVKVVYKPRSREREVLGIAKIISKGMRWVRLSVFPDNEGILIITEEEARGDGFDDIEDMMGWLYDIYGERYQEEPMNKLTLKWVK